MINKLISKFLLLEQYCIFCGCQCDKQICKDCYISVIKPVNRIACPKCLIYLPPKEIKCQNCADNYFYFDRIITGFEYKFPLDQILHQIKYQGKLEYSTVLSQLFWNTIAIHLHKLPDVIIPVPLHHSKHKLRGFNQVYELLREFKDLYPQVPIIKAIRNKETLQQANLNRQQRITNLAGAFKIDFPLNNKHVTIVDDVVTTGTTVNELAKLCKDMGAHQVDVWCLMRAQH